MEIKETKKQSNRKRIEEDIRQHEINRKRELKTKRKQNEIKKDRGIVRKRNEERRQLKQYEYVQTGENLIKEDNKLDEIFG